MGVPVFCVDLVVSPRGLMFDIWALLGLGANEAAAAKLNNPKIQRVGSIYHIHC